MLGSINGLIIRSHSEQVPIAAAVIEREKARVLVLANRQAGCSANFFAINEEQTMPHCVANDFVQHRITKKHVVIARDFLWWRSHLFQGFDGGVSATRRISVWPVASTL
jgi:hypothetical protein